MDTVTAYIASDAATCFRAFTDARDLAAWVPGLRRADILTKARGLAEEVHFEFADFAYTLIYSYDVATHEVRWQPKLRASEGVNGFVRFDDAPGGGTQITYGLAHGEARSAAARELGNANALVAAFVSYVSERRR